MAFVKLPLKEQILEAMQVAETSVEASRYLAERFRAILKKANMTEKAADMLARVDSYADYVEKKLRKIGEPWNGEPAWISDFQNAQRNLATDAAKLLQDEGMGAEVQLGLVVNDESQLVRGYFEKQELMDNKQVAQLDTLFNAWLATHNMVMEGGVVYEADLEGNIKEDKKKGPIKADPETVRLLIDNDTAGYNTFLQKRGLPALEIEQPPLSVPKAPEKPQAAPEEPTAAPEPSTPEDEAPKTTPGR